MNNWPLQKDAAQFYGNPDVDGNGEPDRTWEDANLVRVTPPWQMVLAWDVSKPVKQIRVHKRCAESLQRVLGVIWAHAGASQDQIERSRLHLFGGCYSFRLMRGSHLLSMHSYGCAIDLDPEVNYLGRTYYPHTGMMPEIAIEAFVAEGWTWGGRWTRPDAQHFQAAKV